MAMAHNLLTVGGTVLPQPSTYVGLTADVVNSGRSANGRLIASVICSDIAKVEVTWNYLTAKQWSDVLKLFYSNSSSASGRTHKFVQSVTFFNQTTNGWDTRNMYISDRTSSGVFLCDKVTGKPLGWKGCKLSLIDTGERSYSATPSDGLPNR